VSDLVIPEPTVRKVAPRCRCGSTFDLIEGDGPAVCRACIVEGGKMGQATVRRSDTARDIREADHRNREGYWP
jgi:hypothetical protein